MQQKGASAPSHNCSRDPSISKHRGEATARTPEQLQAAHVGRPHQAGRALGTAGRLERGSQGWFLSAQSSGPSSARLPPRGLQTLTRHETPGPVQYPSPQCSVLLRPRQDRACVCACLLRAYSSEGPGPGDRDSMAPLVPTPTSHPPPGASKHRSSNSQDLGPASEPPFRSPPDLHPEPS